MQENYLKKIDRVTAILIRLQSKKIVKAHELAAMFDVSLRTIYRDIKTLENAGIPIIGEAGMGYSLMEGYKLPPVMFTKEEVLSFITAEKLMQKLSDRGIGTHYESAMQKVKSVLGPSNKDLIQNIENQIGVFDYNMPNGERNQNYISLILESILAKKQILLDYVSANEESSQRMAEAIGVFYEFNHWYVLAYCHLRKAIRQFRLDRIAKITRSEEIFSQEYGHIYQYRKNNEHPKTKICLLVDKKMKPYLTNSKYYYGLIAEEESENGITMTFETEWIDEGFPRWLITFCDYAEIIEPQSLKVRMKELISEISKKLN